MKKGDRMSPFDGTDLLARRAKPPAKRASDDPPFVPDSMYAPQASRRPVRAAPYFAGQPHRCRGEEVGPAGHCLACGADNGVACRSRP